MIKEVNKTLCNLRDNTVRVHIHNILLKKISFSSSLLYDNDYCYYYFFFNKECKSNTLFFAFLNKKHSVAFLSDDKIKMYKVGIKYEFFTLI